MPRLIRVSFDYDDTLSEEDVSRYAEDIRSRGFDCWVVTARSRHDLSDVRKLARRLGFNLEHIVATDLNPKWKFIQVIGPVWHLDDDFSELAMIKSQTGIPAIRYPFNPDWTKECNDLLARHMTSSGFAKRDISKRGLLSNYR